VASQVIELRNGASEPKANDGSKGESAGAACESVGPIVGRGMLRSQWSTKSDRGAHGRS
jgi:hypothetical protein